MTYTNNFTLLELQKAGLVHCVATEDMDALTFKSKTLLRRLTMPEARKLPVQEISYEKMIQMLDLNHEEFIDLCILLGCDYVPSIKGIIHLMLAFLIYIDKVLDPKERLS